MPTDTRRARARLVLNAAIAFALAAMLPACSSGSDSTGSVFTPPTPTTTETFSGTVNVGSSDFHNFTITNAGTLSVTLTAAGPPNTIFMGVGVGNPAAATATAAATCVLLSGGSTLAQASNTPQLQGTIGAGSYCVSVFDVGNQTAAVTYTVTVTHP